MFVRDQRHCKSGRRQRTLSKASVDLVARQAIPLVLAEALERRMLLSGGTFTVSTLADSGAGSLRQAITDADAVGGTDIITFSAVSGTIDLASALPAISSNITINGPGATSLSVNGEEQGSVFVVNTGVTAEIEGLTIGGGSGTTTARNVNCGGGIFNRGVLTVANSTISGNVAKFGGGIENYGTLTVNDSTISGNAGSTIGGGIATYGGLTVTNSTVSGNFASFGGGISVEGGESTAITNSTISGNSAVAYDGGIRIFDSNAIVTDCTISGNSAPSGGGVYCGATGQYSAQCTLDGCIIAANAGGDILLHIGGFGFLFGGSNDLIGDGTDGGILSKSLIGTAANPINPMLSALGNFGGPTQTMELLPDSPAIGAGANFSVLDSGGHDITSADQRGVARPQGSDFDIGAFQTLVSNESPLFTSANSATFTAGFPCTFAIDTIGFPAASLTQTGSLPAGLTFTDKGDGMGTISGTPATGDMGNYHLTLTASNGVTPNATQIFVLTVNQPYFVTTLADEGTGSLRQAITNADTAGGGFIEFVSGLTGTISLASQLPALSAGNIVIDGPGATILTVNGGGFGSVFTIEPDVTAAIEGLTVTGGTGTLVSRSTGGSVNSGGDIFNLGSLTVTDSTISGNSVPQISSAVYGGGIYSRGVMLAVTNSTLTGNTAHEGGGIFTNLTIATIANCTISENIAKSGAGIENNGALTLTSCSVDGNASVGGFASGTEGAGIFSGAAAVIVNCTIDGNSTANAGGAIFSAQGGLNIQNSTISGNTALHGGGIYSFSGGLTVSNSTISGNEAGYVNSGGINQVSGSGGGVYIRVGGVATVTNSTIAGNFAAYGGGISNDGSVTFSGSTISDNSTAPATFPQSNSGGGGVLNYQTLTLINSTVSGNSAAGSISNGEGGGIKNSGGQVSITDSTISGNSAAKGGGIYDAQTLKGTIVAGNVGGDIVGTATGSHDLVGDGSGGTILTNSLLGTVANPLNPMLAPLGNYGGPTQTMPELAGSPAIGAGANFSNLAADQRGFVRPTTSGIDIGADQGALFSGDTNFDGTVNLTDLLALLNNYGETGKGWTQGDFNFDGTVNLTDLLALLNNYGSTALDTGGSTALTTGSSTALTTGGQSADDTSALVSYTVKSTPFASEPLTLNSAGGLASGGAASNSDNVDSEILQAGLSVL